MIAGRNSRVAEVLFRAEYRLLEILVFKKLHIKRRSLACQLAGVPQSGQQAEVEA